MNHFGENADNSLQLNNIHYEHTILVSNTLLSKAEILLLIAFASALHFGYCRNDITVANNHKAIELILYLSFLIRFLGRIFWGVKEESIFIVKTLGLQKTTVYHSNFKSSVFIPWYLINDVIINEAIIMQKVIFYLAVLVKAENQSKGESIIPLFVHSEPRLAELKIIYRKIQWILKD